METEDHIFEAEGALEPNDPSIKHFVLADLGGLYALTVSVLGCVTPFVYYSSSDSGSLFSIIVVIFYTYLYLGSFFCLAYMHTTVRNHRKQQELLFLEKIDSKEKELDNNKHISKEDVILETCKEIHDEEQNDEFGEFTHGDEGVHFLTRVGAIGFALASFIRDGLDLLSFVWEGSKSFECFGAGFIVVIISRIMFVYAIASFIFKYHTIIIHRHMALWKFLIGHLLAASLTLWSTTVVIEAMELYTHTLHEQAEHGEHGDEHGDHGIVLHGGEPTDTHLVGHESSHLLLASTAMPGSHALTEAIDTTASAIIHSLANLTGFPEEHEHSSGELFETSSGRAPPSECLTQDTIGVKASPYLFPFVIEFALIAAAAMHHLYRHIQRKAETKFHAFKENPVDVSRGYECHKSTLGLFFGIMVFAVTTIFTAVYVVVIETHSLEKYRKILSQEYFGIYVSLNILGILTVLVCFYKMRHHRFSDHLESPLDQNLLLLSLGGYYFMIAFRAVAAGVAMTEDDEIAYFGSLHFAANITSFIQITVQTVFIVVGFRMRSKSLMQVVQKPGRAAVTFLLVLNTAMWTCNTFMQKMITESPTMSQFYGQTTWVILFNVLLPLTIFYRFHSAICLAEIWIEAYALEEEEEGEDDHHETRL